MVDKTVYHLKNFINTIEKKFPNHAQIIMTGGKDSQLISLVPKLNSKNWHIFSSEPNFTLVQRWLRENNIEGNRLFKADDFNKETREDFKKKIICGDCYSDPKHIRWLPNLKKIAANFNYKCIFWSGTMADTIYSFHKDYHLKSKKDYFETHMTRACSWQGNYHQTLTNFVGNPLLSPYHSPEIWNDLYQHIDPTIITKNVDLREKIGERLLGRPVWWVSDNPGPSACTQKFYNNYYKIYLSYIKKCLRKKH